MGRGVNPCFKGENAGCKLCIMYYIYIPSYQVCRYVTNVNLSINAQAEPNKENVLTGLTVCPLLCSFSFVFLVSICTL